MDRAPQQDPDMRMVTVGHAVQAMVLNGLGFLKQQLYLMPPFFHHKPISRLVAPGMPARPLHADPLGRARDTLSAYGVTALSSLMAAPAAQRLGLAPGLAHLESTSFHGDGRSHRE